jgi:hypothetical protein
MSDVNGQLEVLSQTLDLQYVGLRRRSDTVFLETESTNLNFKIHI